MSMSINVIKEIDKLTAYMTIIRTTRVLRENGVESVVGIPERTAYQNDTVGRITVTDNEPEDIVNAVMAMWGEKPIINLPSSTVNIDK